MTDPATATAEDLQHLGDALDALDDGDMDAAFDHLEDVENFEGALEAALYSAAANATWIPFAFVPPTYETGAYVRADPCWLLEYRADDPGRVRRRRVSWSDIPTAGESR